MAVTVCGKCNRRMAHTRSGIEVVETKEDGSTPYQVWSYDEYHCQGCDAIVYAGRGEGPIVKSYETERLAAYNNSLMLHPHFR